MDELQFPATAESISYGTPSFKIGKKFLCRILDDGETLVIHADDRDEWLAEDDTIFFFTEHYRNYPYVLVRLKKISRPLLRKLLVKSWKELASATQLKKWEQDSE